MKNYIPVKLRICLYLLGLALKMQCLKFNGGCLLNRHKVIAVSTEFICKFI